MQKRDIVAKPRATVPCSFLIFQANETFKLTQNTLFSTVHSQRDSLIKWRHNVWILFLLWEKQTAFQFPWDLREKKGNTGDKNIVGLLILWLLTLPICIF